MGSRELSLSELGLLGCASLCICVQPYLLFAKEGGEGSIRRFAGTSASLCGSSLISVNEEVPFITLKPFHDSLINFLLSNCGTLVGCSITSACY